MKNLISYFLIYSLFLVSCSSKKYVSSQSEDIFPTVVRNDITYMFSQDYIRSENSDIVKGWANRNNVWVHNIQIINNTDEPIHGSQFCFYSDGEKLELVNNKLAAKKLNSRQFPKIVYIIPIVLVIVLALAIIGADSDNLHKKESSETEDELQGKNAIQRGLNNFNVAKEILYPGEQISGLIAIKSEKPITKLDIQILDVDYNVVK